MCPRTSYYQKNRERLLQEQRARRKKEKEERDKARGISLEELARQRRQVQNRQDPWSDKEATQGANCWND